MAVEPEDERIDNDEDAHGPLDKGVWLDPATYIGVIRVSFGGEILTVPEGSDERATRWLMIASSSGTPVTMEVDNQGVIRHFRMEEGEYSVEFSLPDGPIQFNVPDDP